MDAAPAKTWFETAGHSPSTTKPRSPHEPTVTFAPRESYSVERPFPCRGNPRLLVHAAPPRPSMLAFDWPTFRGVESTPWLIVLIVVAAASVGCITFLYGYERQLVDRKLGNTLLGLRLASLAVILFALFEPVSRWSEDITTTGRVVVAIDVSESMDTQDAVATPAEKLRLAKGLGMLGHGEAAERVDPWIAAYEARKEPEWVLPQETNDADSAEHSPRGGVSWSRG